MAFNVALLGVVEESADVLRLVAIGDVDRVLAVDRGVEELGLFAAACGHDGHGRAVGDGAGPRGSRGSQQRDGRSEESNYGRGN